jgi:hypothetical protein
MKILEIKNYSNILEVYSLKNVRFIADAIEKVADDVGAIHIIFPDECQDYLDGLEVGIYQTDNEVKSVLFSFSGYLSFRNVINKVANHESVFEEYNGNESVLIGRLPFFELINLINGSNRVGTIGSHTAGKLFDDFNKYYDLFLTELNTVKLDQNSDELIDIFIQIKHLFEYAKENGFIYFT